MEVRPARPAPSVAAAAQAWAAACVAAGCAARTPVEDLAVPRAARRVTAAPLVARWSVPAYPVAAMDGVAVCAADTGAGGVLLDPGRFDEVDTGDPIPPGRDAVVMREHLVRRADGAVALREAARPGQHVRGVGEDLRAGQPLLPAGHRLRPVDLAALAAAGHRTVPVHRRPVVAIVPTGDEVRPIGADLGRGEVLDTNSLMIAETVREAGGLARVAPIVPDHPGALTAALRAAGPGADLVAVLAGSSAGRDDHTAAVVAALGSVVVHGVAMRPGHPVLLGVLGGPAPVPVIGVPGYPASAALAVELFALPVLAALLGAEVPPRRTEPVRAAVDIPSRPGVEEHILVVLDGAGAVVPLRRGAGACGALAQAEGVVRVPVGDAGPRAGDTVEVAWRAGAPRAVAAEAEAGSAAS